MAVDPRHYHYYQRQHQVKNFDWKLRQLLTDNERKYLCGILKDYQTHRQVDLLVDSLQMVLNTPAKSALLMDIRHVLPASDQERFDRFMSYHKIMHSVDMLPTTDTAVNEMVVVEDSSPVYGSLGRLYIPRTRERTSGVSMGIDQASKNRTQSLDRRARSGGPTHLTHSQPRSSRPLISEVTADGEEPAHIQMIDLVREADESIGFSVRGGSDHGLGIYVSEVSKQSAAARAGLRPGDRLLEVNAIPFENIASSSAVKVLTGTHRLRMSVRREGRIPSFKLAQEKTTWYDVANGCLITGSLEDHGTQHYPAGLAYVDGVVERRVSLALERQGQHLGFNIRGGSEYGLGIYVSRVDAGGLAEEKGLKIGDQITACNGNILNECTHEAAVDMLKSQNALVLTVRECGVYPAFKEIYAEYSWINTRSGIVSHSRTGIIASVPVTAGPQETNSSIFTEYPLDSDLDSVRPNIRITSSDAGDVEQEQKKCNLYPAAFNIGSDFPEELDREEQVREMTFPDDACLTVSLPESPNTTDESTGETPENVIRQLDTVLLPHSDDVILQERPHEELVASKSNKEKKSDKMSHKSQIGVYALQLENLPSEVNASSTSNRTQIQSLRRTGEINPRQFGSGRSMTRKSWTLRELIFGSKSREKIKGEKAFKPRSKVRQPLTNLGFVKPATNAVETAGSLDLNIEEQDRAPSFVRGLGSQIMLQEALNCSNGTTAMNERIRELLTSEQQQATSSQIEKYKQNGNIRTLIDFLSTILDEPEKKELLHNIRGIIQPNDLCTFDEMLLEGATQTSDDEESGIVAVDDENLRNIESSKSAVDYVHKDLPNFVEDKCRTASEDSPMSKPQAMKGDSVGVTKSGSMRSKRVLEILRPKSTSKVYKALKVTTTKNAQTPQLVEKLHGGQQPVSGQIHADRQDTECCPPVTQYKETDYDATYSSIGANSRRSSVSSTGMSGAYSLNGEQQEDFEFTSDMYCETDKTFPNNENVVLISQKTLKDTAHPAVIEGVRGQTEPHTAMVELLDGLTIDDDTATPPDSPRSVVCASHDVKQQQKQTERPPRTPPVFVPPPPPPELPPPVATPTQDAWSEWIEEDVTDEVLHSSGRSSTDRTRRDQETQDESTYETDNPYLSYLVNTDVTDMQHNVSSLTVLDSSNTTPGTRNSDLCEDGDEGRNTNSNNVNSCQDHRSQHNGQDFVDSLTSSISQEKGHNYKNKSPIDGQRHVFSSSSMYSVTDSSAGQDTLRSRMKSRIRPSIKPECNSLPDGLFPSGWTWPKQNDGEKYDVKPADDLVEINRLGQFQTTNDDEVIAHEKYVQKLEFSQHELGDRISDTSCSLYRNDPKWQNLSEHFKEAESGRHFTHSVSTESAQIRPQQALDALLYGMDTELTELQVHEPRLIILKKSCSSLGMSVSGGRNCGSQPHVKVEKIFPNGAASNEGSLKVGMRLLAVDGQSLEGVTHPQAVELIRKAYTNKKECDMELLVIP